MRITQLLANSRLFLLLFLVPPAAMWAHMDHSGGWLLPTVIALYACTRFAIFDTKTLRAGKRQRLSFTRNPHAGDPSITEMLGTYCLILLAVALLVTLFVAPGVAVLWILVSVLTLPLMSGVGSRVGTRISRWSMFLSEIAEPGLLILLPALWLSGYAGTNVQPGMWTITLLCALAMCAYLLTCLIRDAGEDRTDGQITTPTVLGTHTATLLLMLVLVVMQFTGAIGLTPEAGLFTTITPAATALGGMMTLYAVLTGADDAAPRIMLLTQIALILSFIA